VTELDDAAGIAFPHDHHPAPNLRSRKRHKKTGESQ